MGVYIKGMEMPKSCAECKAEGHYENSYGDEYGFFCPFGYKAYTRETRELKRLDDCPLVPVPPHGRLIDAKYIDSENDRFFDMSQVSEEFDEHASAYAYSLIANILANAPTIISAEESEI